MKMEEIQMDRTSFEAKLQREGYPEIRVQSYQPNHHNAEHSHPFDAHALILEGAITITVDGKPTTYRAGDQFMVKAGTRHTEDMGPQGVSYVVGRRPI
jgi:quercetin dioxygenase-like cupin family protein